MRTRILSIWSVLLLLVVSLAVLIPGCSGTTVTTGCTIDVEATFDGTRWTGGVQYTLTGPSGASITGTSVDTSHSVNCGGWTCAYVSGGPTGASFASITPLATQTVSAVGTITFTLNFVTPAAAVLDHFKCYGVQGSSIDEVVPKLEDQFGAVEATITNPKYFCNPVAKTYDGTLTPILNQDHHLTLYDMTCNTTQTWHVEVDNQFGRQEFTVSGPVMVAVPTKKEEHSAPVGLDHFLLYRIEEDTQMQLVVDLEDQWHLEEDVQVLRPAYFAIPAEKTDPHIDAPANVIPIQHPDAHLTFYKIIGDHFQTDVDVVNQFGPQTLSTYQETQLLAVPSEKISFEQGEPEPSALDHFTCYWTGEDMVIGQDVRLEDQFGTWEVMVEESWYLCNPAEKTHDEVLTPISDLDHHLMIYSITPQPDYWYVQVSNQFGTYQLTLQGPMALAVPTQKLSPGNHGLPVDLDHFLLYEVVPPGATVNQIVDLNDEFADESDLLLTEVVFFANPVKKILMEGGQPTGDVYSIQNPDDHLLFCAVEHDIHSYQYVNIDNQFGDYTFSEVEGPWLLAVPSDKISFEQVEAEPLDHFMCYWVGEDMVLPDWPGVVHLEDQFCSVEAQVSSPWGFFNPVEKWHDGVLTPILNPNHHLLAYDILCEEEPQWWQVEVNNQFGIQSLIVYGPVALGLPTQKIEPLYHAPPVGLDHFMLYEVIEGPPVNVIVSLNDQFGDQPQVEVGYPDYFFVPVQKTDASGMVTEIQNPLGHLVSYEIWAEVLYQQVQAVNQFGQYVFPDLEGPYCLTVPSEKMTWQQLPPQQ